MPSGGNNKRKAPPATNNNKKSRSTTMPNVVSITLPPKQRQLHEVVAMKKMKALQLNFGNNEWQYSAPSFVDVVGESSGFFRLGNGTNEKQHAYALTSFVLGNTIKPGEVFDEEKMDPSMLLGKGFAPAVANFHWSSTADKDESDEGIFPIHALQFVRDPTKVQVDSINDIRTIAKHMGAFIYSFGEPREDDVKPTIVEWLEDCSNKLGDQCFVDTFNTKLQAHPTLLGGLFKNFEDVVLDYIGMIDDAVDNEQGLITEAQLKKTLKAMRKFTFELKIIGAPMVPKRYLAPDHPYYGTNDEDLMDI